MQETSSILKHGDQGQTKTSKNQGSINNFRKGREIGIKHVEKLSQNKLDLEAGDYLIAAYKFCKQRIEVSQVSSEYLIVHKAHAFNYLKDQVVEKKI